MARLLSGLISLKWDAIASGLCQNKRSQLSAQCGVLARESLCQGVLVAGTFYQTFRRRFDCE
jgi:hypothetical protein